jgi:hypothetical protein
VLQDFLFLRHFSYGCKQVYSADRWALTGEAGLFLDPFYSPGSDFIAISNTYVCDLVEKERAGQSIAAHADIYQQLYFSFYENTLTLYQDQYPIFGDPQVMPVKIAWDYAYYWALLAPLFFGKRQTELAVLNRLKPAFVRGRALNLAMQRLLRDWGARNAAGTPVARRGRLLDQYALGWCRDMNGALTEQLDDDAFAARIAANVARMEWLAAEVLAQAQCAHPQIDDQGLVALLGDAAANPESLPAHWYVDAA